MILHEAQLDALKELINISFARTALSLSDMTGNRVEVDVPAVALHPISELTDVLSNRVSGEVATVHQIFNGQVAGDALLLLDQKSALHLSNLLVEVPLGESQWSPTAREVLTEVGNIMLNSCLGVFGNLLEVMISFSVPRLHLESLGALLNSLTVKNEDMRYALVIMTGMRVSGGNVNGFLVICLGVTSLERLLSAVEHWEEVQLS